MARTTYSFLHILVRRKTRPSDTGTYRAPRQYGCHHYATEGRCSDNDGDGILGTASSQWCNYPTAEGLSRQREHSRYMILHVEQCLSLQVLADAATGRPGETG